MTTQIIIVSYIVLGALLFGIIAMFVLHLPNKLRQYQMQKLARDYGLQYKSDSIKHKSFLEIIGFSMREGSNKNIITGTLNNRHSIEIKDLHELGGAFPSLSGSSVYRTTYFLIDKQPTTLPRSILFTGTIPVKTLRKHIEFLVEHPND